MIAVSADPVLREAIKTALRRRLATMSSIGAPVFMARCAVEEGEVEEALWFLMVIVRPKLRSAAPLSDEARVMSALALVVARCSWTDLRFVDCLNVLFETWAPKTHPSLRGFFLEWYRHALERMLH